HFFFIPHKAQWMQGADAVELSHAGLRTQANPRLPGKSEALPALAAVIWSGNPSSITQKISDLPLSHCALETGQAAGSCSNPLCVFATLRLCVEIDAGKTQRRKDAKSQRMKRTRARLRTSSLSDGRQPPVGLGFTLSVTAASRSLDALVSCLGHD